MGSSVLIYSSEITEEPAQKVEVPDLFGKSKLRAYDALKEAGLIMDEAALAAVGGSVESQSPSAGTMVEAGSVVTVRFKSD
jgi:beta-lactam-binding protein with PASTA domain